MVTAADTGLEIDAEELGFDAGDAIDDSTTAGAGAEPPEDTPDPLADIRSQVAAAASREELESLRNQIRSELGRSQKLEARLEALASTNPLADVDPRLDANESLLASIADALIDSDLTDDRMKTALKGARSALDAATGERAHRRMEKELTEKVLKALPQSREQERAEDEQPSGPWAQAQDDVVADLRERLPDVYPKTMSDEAVRLTIPPEVWATGQAKGTPGRAVAHVVRWAEQQAEEPAAARTAVRRQAAGPGSPPRSGGASSVEQDRQRLMSEGIPQADEAARRRVAATLGVQI